MRTLRLTEEEYVRLVARRALGKKPVPAVQNRGRRWEDAFAAQLEGARIPFRREFRFLADRRFRFDFVVLPIERAIAVEVDGMVHRIKGRFRSDREKGNLALVWGWRVLHVDSGQVRSGEALELLKTLLDGDY